MLLYSLQNMSYFASIMVMSFVCPFVIDKNDVRPLQLNYRDPSSTTFFIRVSLIYKGPLRLRQNHLRKLA